jgi:hypothetical protein
MPNISQLANSRQRSTNEQMNDIHMNHEANIRCSHVNTATSAAGNSATFIHSFGSIENAALPSASNSYRKCALRQVSLNSLHTPSSQKQLGYVKNIRGRVDD